MTATTAGAGEIPAIHDKQTLILALQDAAVLEHQFMCQYLYAAFSLKKQPDATCSPSQFEHVRRWASTIYMIARQEMEHLSIANSLLTAIGGGPRFVHLNFPTIMHWYQKPALLAKHGLPVVDGAVDGQGAAQGMSSRATVADLVPCEIPFVLEKLRLNTVRRFACMEGPTLVHVPAADRKTIRSWCFEDRHGHCTCVAPEHGDMRARSLMADSYHLNLEEVAIGNVQELYEAIRKGFIEVSRDIGEKALFSGHPSGQDEIPSEYNIYLFPITDLRSALAGIDLITEQGEGIGAEPGYESHFLHFFDMARDYQALLGRDPSFDPALPLPLDPQLGSFDNPLANQAVAVFNRGYIALLYMLTGYYAHYSKQSFDKFPHLSAALEQTAFAPLMTMLVRSLAEVITRIPSGNGDGPAGPTFFISPGDRAWLMNPDASMYQEIGFYHDQLAGVVRGLEGLLTHAWEPELERKLVFMYQSMSRTLGNLGYVYNRGVFPKFDPNRDASCASTKA